VTTRSKSRFHDARITAVLCAVLTGCNVVAPNDGSKPPANEGEWTTQMTQLAMPAKGCFTAAFPKLEWTATSCEAPPDLPYPPVRARHDPYVVGAGTDYVATVAGTMNSATGSFPTVTGVTSESGVAGGTGSPVANTYSLQLNTDFFTTTVCAGHPSCLGWQQFLYSSNAQRIFIQYWLIQYNGTCPASWNTYPYPGTTDIYCWRNGPNGATVARQPITSLSSLTLTGNANTGGTDSVIMGTPGGTLSAANQDSILNLAASWKSVEFVLVGDCCNSQATFNAGATVGVRVVVHDGSTSAPNCSINGYTAETNNLTLVGTGTLAVGAAPSVQNTQSNLAGTARSCSAASGLGDTHLRTFGGLLYDFQASGDFLLADAADFTVQARQVSGAPNWPNASVNQAVATKMGATKVTMCLPDRVVVDGNGVTVDDGKPLSLPSGVDVIRNANVYNVFDQSGNSVRAVMNGTWMDVSVGLGTWPTTVKGLLADTSADRKFSLIGSDGTAYTTPISFGDLYDRYGESWRVGGDASLLLECGPEPEHGNPKEPFFVGNLPGDLRERAQAVCQQKGVKDGALLDACTLDVAVIGDDRAADVYVGAEPPIAVGQ
jgi:hypothetical protein